MTHTPTHQPSQQPSQQAQAPDTPVTHRGDTWVTPVLHVLGWPEDQTGLGVSHPSTMLGGGGWLATTTIATNSTTKQLHCCLPHHQSVPAAAASCSVFGNNTTSDRLTHHHTPDTHHTPYACTPTNPNPLPGAGAGPQGAAACCTQAVRQVGAAAVKHSAPPHG